MWSRVGVGLLALGLLVRALLYVPPAMFQIDSDAVLAGLCAFRIAHGQHPIFFPGGTRLSAASCYVAVAYFHLFGAGRVGLALTALTWAVLYLTFTLLFLRATLGPKLACLGLLFAILPSEQFMTVTYAPWGYGEIVASCAATLWLAALWRNEGALWQRLCFGLSVGLGIWFSLETLMAALPAIAWIALKRRGATIDESLPAIVTAIVGAAPFLIGNVGHDFPSLTQNWASRPASNAGQAWQNFVWLVSYLIPKLLFRSSGFWSESTILMAASGLVAIGFAQALRRRPRSLASGSDVRDLAQLLALAAAACVLIFSLSQAGSGRGWTVRYIAPLYVVFPLFAAIGIAALWHWSRWLAGVTVAAILIPNLLVYGLPGSKQRAELTAQLINDVRVRRLLEEHRVRLVYGNYFWVYHLNFDSQEKVAGVPFLPYVDYLDYGNALGTSPVRYAFLGSLYEIARWVREVHARGSTTKDGDLWLFIADRPASDAAKLLATLRSAQP